MANDSRPEIVLDGDVSPFRQKMREAASDLKRFGAEGEQAIGRLTGPLATLQSKFVAIGAILAGGAVFKEAVAQTAKYTEESIKLGRAMGISASEASVLREALEAGNTSQEEFVGAAKGLAKQIRENEDGLQAMGLKTRDAAGQLRPLNDLTLDAIAVLNSYRAGTDRAMAGQVMFGKGFEMTSNLAEMNKQAVGEVAEQMRALGVVVGEENVKAWKKFDDAGDKANITFKGIKITIGNALLPVLTAISEALARNGKDMVAFARLVTETFLGLVDLVRLVKQAFVSVGSDIGALAAAAAKALAGDFSGAAAIVRERIRDAVEETKRLKDLWSGAGDSFLGKFRAQKNQKDVPKPDDGGKSGAGLIKTDKDKKTKVEEPSHMSVYEARLAEIKNTYEQENALRQFSKEQELAYWRELQQSYDLTSKDRLNIAKRTATLELEIRRQSAKEQRDLEMVGLDHRRAAGLAQVQFEEQQAGFARENRDITKRQLLDLEEQFARRRFEIEYQSLLERLELAKSDPNASPAELARIKEEMLAIERQYQIRRGEIAQGKKKDEGSLVGVFDGVGDSFGQAASAMLTRATTLQQQLGNIFQSIYQSFVQNLIVKPVAQWIAGLARMLAVKLGFLGADESAQTASSAKIATTKGTEAASVATANAVEAGSGAAASQASIPYIGPILALAAMATVFAAVMALGKRKSAARGYDIPKGLNPLVQTHEEEMILPQKYANVIRNLAGGDGAGGGAGAGMVFAPTIKAMDSRDVIRALKEGGALHKALKDMERSFVR